MVWTKAEKRAARKRTAAKAPERAKFWEKKRKSQKERERASQNIERERASQREERLERPSQNIERERASQREERGGLIVKKTPIKPETIKAIMPSKKEAVIRLGKPEEKKDVKAESEKARFNLTEQIKRSWEKPVGDLGSLKTTAVLAATLGAVTGIGYITGVFGAGTAAGQTAVITRTATIGKASLTTQRAFIGKGGTTIVDKLFKALPKTASVTSRYGAHSKSQMLTLGYLAKTVTNPAAILAIIGTYPFAGFIKEEALQTLGFGVHTALGHKDAEGAQIALDEQERIVEDVGRLIHKIPFLNIVAQLRTFYNAAKIKLEIDRRAVEQLQAERIGELEERGLDAEYYRLIREKKFEEAEALRTGELEKLKGG